MSKHYLQIDFKSSQFTEYSKDPKEGFESVQGKTGYHKRHNEGSKGTLMNVSLRDSKIGKQISVVVKDYEGNFNYLQFNLYSQKGEVDNTFAESLIRVLPSLKKGEDYRFFPYNLTADTQRESDVNAGNEVRAKYYDNRGVSVKKVNGPDLEKVPTLLYNKKGENDPNKIPLVVWEKDVMGDNKPTAVSVEAKKNFLLTVLKNAVDGHLAYEASQNTNTSGPTPTQNTSAPEPTPANTESLPTMTPDQAFETVPDLPPVDLDDLPF